MNYAQSILRVRRGMGLLVRSTAFSFSDPVFSAVQRNAYPELFLAVGSIPIALVLCREPDIPSYWCTVQAPSLSDFVSSLGKTNASLRSTNPSQTDFAADSMASDAEAFILSQSSDSADRKDQLSKFHKYGLMFRCYDAIRTHLLTGGWELRVEGFL